MTTAEECAACGMVTVDAVAVELPTRRDEPPDGYYLCQPCADERAAATEDAAERRAEARRDADAGPWGP